MKYRCNNAVIVLLLSHLLQNSWRTQLEVPKSGLYTHINGTEIVIHKDLCVCVCVCIEGENMKMIYVCVCVCVCVCFVFLLAMCLVPVV
jgi:hypothetical protein